MYICMSLSAVQLHAVGSTHAYSATAQLSIQHAWLAINQAHLFVEFKYWHNSRTRLTGTNMIMYW
jgi:hypothetical protein